MALKNCLSPRILLLSNSTMPNSMYMEWVTDLIEDFLDISKVKEILFIPFAGVRIEWDEYTSQVQTALSKFKIQPIHKTENYIEAIRKAEAIMIGGGNTFHLLYKLYEYHLLEPIRERILASTNSIPYIGWSAGSNVAGPDVGSSNDMPIIWPVSDRSLNLVPYNLNPHYNEWSPPNVKCETRIDRLNECVTVKRRAIVAYSEGVAIKIENGYHKIVAPPIKPECFGEGGDKRCVKVWTVNSSGKPKIDQINLNDDLNHFLPSS